MGRPVWGCLFIDVWAIVGSILGPEVDQSGFRSEFLRGQEKRFLTLALRVCFFEACHSLVGGVKKYFRTLANRVCFLRRVMAAFWL